MAITTGCVHVGKWSSNHIRVSSGPFQAMREWLEVADIHAGPGFRYVTVHGQLKDKPLSRTSPSYILRQRCKQAGLRPDYYGSQSLCSGFYLTMAEQNVDIDIVARHAGLKDVDGLYERHFKRAYRWADAPRSIDEQRPNRKVKWHE